MSYYRQYQPMGNSQFPPGVLNLIILNGIMFAAKMFAASHLVDLDALFGLFNPYSPNFHWYQFITSLFMHANFGHIFSNMFGLWIFGHMLENAFGTKRFLIYYFICGLGASAIYLVWQTIDAHNYYQQFGDGWALLKAHPPRGMLIGASGAVFGLLIGAALLFPNTEMFIFFIPFPVKLKWLAILYGGEEIYRGFHTAAGDNVAHFAHIGGMIFGFILIKLFARDRSNFY